ncbi:hypothetical protein ACWFRB_09200 [Rhodococcus sp. NPDC055112]
MDVGVYQLAATLVGELSAQLEDTRAGAVRFATVHPGDTVPAYGCGCGTGEGQAWVRVVGMYPSVNFPEPYVIPQPGAPIVWAVTLEMGVDRCYPSPEQNEMPTPGELDSAARDAMDDAAAMRRAAMCAFDRSVQAVPGMWEPRGPSGGIHGGVMAVTVLVDVACGCDSEPPQLDAMVPPVFGDPRFPA